MLAQTETPPCCLGGSVLRREDRVVLTNVRRLAEKTSNSYALPDAGSHGGAGSS